MSNWFGILLITIYIFQLISLLAVVFIEDKDPVVTISWMLALAFLPILGFVLYLFFGRGLKKFSNKRLRLIRRIQEEFFLKTPAIEKEFEELGNILHEVPPNLNDQAAYKHLDLIRMNTRLGFSSYTQNNDIKIYIDAKEKYKELFEDIRNAKQSIHMVYFIISNTQISYELIDLLAQKAEEGVEVRLIYDELGNILVPRKIFNKIKKAGGEVYRFFPISFSSVLHANYRNHHKIVVIDGEIGYTGGMNIGDEYMGLHHRKTPWRDTHMRLTGSSVESLQLLFVIDLIYTTNNKDLLDKYISPKYFHRTNSVGKVGMQIVSSGPDSETEAIRRAYIKMIDNAKKSVYIQTPYLMPDQAVITSLQNAAAAGVEVNIMLPGIPDKRIVYMVTYSYIQTMLDYGINIYIYDGFLHSKMIVIDDEIATIGTTNLDMRSFSMHFEVNGFIYNTPIAEKCGDIFRDDLKKCYLMTQEKYDSRNFFQKGLEKIFRLLAPLM